MRVSFWRYALIILAGMAIMTAPARALTCNHSQSFGTWLRDFKREAVSMGISQRTVNVALQGVTYAPDIVRKDRAQGVFSQTCDKFSGRMVAAYRLKRGRALIRKHRSIFARVKQKYGVPAPVIVGFWGLGGLGGGYRCGKPSGQIQERQGQPDSWAQPSACGIGSLRPLARVVWLQPR